MAQRQSLSEDMGHFDAALLALRTGNDEVLPPHEAAQQAQLGEAMGSWETCDDALISTATVQLKWCETSAPGKNLSSTASVIDEFGLPNAWN